MKKIILRIIIIFVVGYLLLKLSIAAGIPAKLSRYITEAMKEYVVTTDLADYGQVTGNLNNKDPQNYVNAFFPVTIEDYFSNPEYYYRGQNIDSCACEMYLEFTIDDPAKFNEHYESLMQFGVPQNAYFDNQYEIWFTGNNILDFLNCAKFEHDKEAGYRIDQARLGIILCDKEQQQFVYSTIYVWDGGTATTKELGHFFDKFGIDPREFSIEYDLQRLYPITDCQHLACLPHSPRRSGGAFLRYRAI